MSQTEWLIVSWIIAIFGWSMFFAERICLRKVAESGHRTFKALNEAIDYKDQTITKTKQSEYGSVVCAIIRPVSDEEFVTQDRVPDRPEIDETSKTKEF